MKIPKTIPVSLAITQPQGSGKPHVSIRIADELSGVQFVEVQVDLADFTQALGGRYLTDQKCTIKGLDVVGKTKVTEPRKAECQLKSYDRQKLERWIVDNCQEDGWSVNPSLGSQSSITYKNNVTVLNYSVFKYVEP